MSSIINGVSTTVIVQNDTESVIMSDPGPVGPPGPAGAAGAAGQGVAAGGTTNQVLAKNSNANYDTKWVDQSGGGSSVWGGITGTLSAQTDLQAALDAKVPITRTVNGKALSANISITASDVGLGNVTNTSDANKPVSTAQQTALDLKANLALVGAASGIAPLDSGSKVPAAYLPSYVDDVLEFANLAAFPAVGETGKIYIAIDTNREYRWSGSVYVQIVASPGTTDNVPEGTTNLYFTAARAIASVITGFAASAGTVAATDTILQAFNKVVGNIALRLLASNNLSDLSSVATARTNLGVDKHAIPFGSFGAADNGTLKISYFPHAGTLTTIRNLATTSGTITLSVLINGVAVTGMTNIAVTSTPQTATATANNVLALGDVITIVLSSNASAQNLSGSLLYSQ